MAYNYLEAVKDDVRDYIEHEINLKDFTRDELEEQLNDDLWTDDSVTGNASGSYTFNSYQAQENLVGNWDLVAEALDEFGDTSTDAFRKGAEWCDVIVRCYFLGTAISEVLDEYSDDEFAEE